MSDPRRRKFLGLALAAAAVVAGIYGLAVAERKGSSTAAGISPAATGGHITREFARDSLAAFLVKPQRTALPDIAFQDGSGAPLRLSAWKGRVVLVNLWATWCAPCRKEMKTLAALQSKLGSPDFEVVAISVDRKGVEASSAFLAETGAQSLRLYVEPSARIVADLQTVGLPSTFLVDRAGREIGRLLGPAEWDSPEAVALVEAAVAEKAD
jgi:thiol-disulfide isomerase/thioredoxin